MNNTTIAANNQQVIDKNLQNIEQKQSIYDANQFNRADRHHLERVAKKEAKKEGEAS